MSVIQIKPETTVTQERALATIKHLTVAVTALDKLDLRTVPPAERVGVKASRANLQATLVKVTNKLNAKSRT